MTTFIVPSWIADLSEDLTVPLPAFEGQAYGTWNGWAEWVTGKGAVQAFIKAQNEQASEEEGTWSLDGDTLVTPAADPDEPPDRVEPISVIDGDPEYDMSLGMIWVTFDYYDEDRLIQPYDWDGKALPVMTVQALQEYLETRD